ncbi:site-specific DNA-methyltransferase [Faecalibacterium prausnitzii]|jgi:adenine-specific DNA-methyltransferase|uniref:Site-specific DNA-methyltransferase n=2 Tax=Faecalibacterium prausnitzii TaxID=853 RepID=A0A2J4JRI3_9FIRM|nr:site-specific DNA-methyltransferase [Faecalibacterium prausnitzii]PLK30477.1 site-specific DNA-methyltransferase [Faecalibacterium prausnitzii]
METLKMHSLDGVQRNIELIGKLFPNAITEVKRDGKVEHAIDFDVLRQELSDSIVEGREERYQFTWPDKKKAMLAANAPITATLRPVVADSVGKDGTPSGFDSENLYIEGDNLEVLKLLQETYLGKVKMIYIDPPYNTGNDFVYEDDFAQSAADYMDNSGQYDEEGNRLVSNPESNGRFHTDWLNMIYPRLKIAKNLLTDDGVIFISINDQEVVNTRKISDEILGADNFIASLIWQQRKGGGNDSRYIAVDHEYILIYSKNTNNLSDRWYISQTEEYLKRYKEVENDGRRYYWDTLVRNGLQNPIVITLTAPDGTSVTINSQKSKETVIKGLKEGTVRFTKTANGWSLHHKVYMKNGQVLRSILTEYGNNRSSGLELMDLFGKTIFDYSKPSTLLKLLCQLNTKNDDIILDFFSGSATTAHAVMKLNAEDGGHRKFIMVQLPEKTDEKSKAYKAGYKNICEIGKERIRRAGKQILSAGGGQLSFSETQPDQSAPIDIGFRCLRLDSSNMENVYYTPEETQQQDLFSLVDNVKSDRTPEDLLFQVMLDLGVLLSSPIEVKEIAGKKVFNVADGFLLACFDHDVTEETVKAIAQMKPYYAVFRDSSMANDSVATNFDQIFETYSPETVRKVL